jgi:hypothetical protein
MENCLVVRMAAQWVDSRVDLKAASKVDSMAVR